MTTSLITPTRRSLVVRLMARLRVVYLRWLVRHAESDLAHHKALFDHASKHLPAQMRVDQQHIDSLTLQLTRALRDI